MVDQQVFARRYEQADSDWGGNSGPGSSPYWNIDYRAFLERFIHLNNVRSIVDIGCGDWQFSRFVNFTGVRYHGFDVVEGVVQHNRIAYGSATTTFDLMPENFADVPDADLLIMKDVLQHLPDRDIIRHRDELFPRYRRCLISNSYRKAGTAQNIDIAAGDFRCVDLTVEPYNFRGDYVLEFSTIVYEQIRTMLLIRPEG